MKKIALVGLYSIKNMGDRVICDTTRYLFSKFDDIEIIEVDALPRQKSAYKGFAFLKYSFSVLMLRTGKKIFNQPTSSKFRYFFEKTAWLLRVGSHYRRNLKNVDAIVFAGGGFLKFKTQGLNYYVEQIVKIAAKGDIPIMFSGVGIEGYDENDIRCQKLKSAINNKCVKIITTRDYIDILDEKYIVNKEISTAQVGDPAFWTPECYQISPNTNSETIGINVIRGNVYKDYGNNMSYDELKEFYKILIKECQRRNLSWKLFSNGMKGDQQFGREILRELKLPVAANLLPAPDSAATLVKMISEFKAILGARLHACIVAYTLDVPVTGLVWNEKTEMFAKITQRSNHYFAETNLDISMIVDDLVNDTDNGYDKNIRNVYKQKTKDYIVKFVNLIIEESKLI